MGEALDITPASTLTKIDFKFTPSGIKVFIPLSQSFAEPQLALEHPKSDKAWIVEHFDSDATGQSWLIPFQFLELNGSYQFRYSDKINGIARVLGKDVAQAVKTDAERLIQRSLFQRTGALLNAEIYIPYTKKSARLRVREAFSKSDNSKSLEHLTVKSIIQKNGEFRFTGTAFVPGIPSLYLRPFLTLKNESGDEVLRIAGERKRSMGNQNRYGFADCDYTDSGYLFRVPTDVFTRDERLKAPSRLKVCVCMVGDDGTCYEKTLKATPASLNSKLRTLVTIKSFTSKNILSVISAFTNDDIFITHRVEEEILSRVNSFKRSMAFRIYKALGKPTSKNWLLYEFEANAAQDNGLALFEYLRSARKDLKVKYIIDRRSPDAVKLKAYGGSVISKYSFRHYWSLLTAQILISSQSRYHGYRLAPPKSDPIGRQMATKPFVFLQHGVIALKKISFHRSNPRVASDLFFSSTALEQSIICREYGYEPEEVPLVGLPRFDKLTDKSDSANEILVMPTWRKWLQHANTHAFRSSDFFRNYITFLKSTELADVCKAKNMKIKLYLHPVISKHIDCFKGLPSHVEIIANGEEPINELMMKAKILVTDYSSVAWDFMYMKKPVAFFHFDLTMYDEVHGSYFDLKRDLGPSSTKSAGDLVALIKSWARGKQWPAPTINEFKYIDRNNCVRAVGAIEKLLASQKTTQP